MTQGTSILAYVKSVFPTADDNAWRPRPVPRPQPDPTEMAWHTCIALIQDFERELALASDRHRQFQLAERAKAIARLWEALELTANAALDPQE